MPKRAAIAAEGGAAAKGFVPDPSLRPISIDKPKLDVSAAAPGGDQELWLLQLPLDFPANAEADWQISEDPVDGFRGRCTVQGVDYLLVPENEALSADLYATPAGAHGALVPVVRRMTVVRATPAPQLCFGQSEAEAELAGAVAPGAPGQRRLAPPGGKPGKRPRVEQQQAAQQQAAAAAVQQQQPESGKKQKKEKRRKGEEAAAAGTPAAAPAAPAAAPAAGVDGSEKKKEKKEKKEKSAKKEKKDKKEKKKDKS